MSVQRAAYFLLRMGENHAVMIHFATACGCCAQQKVVDRCQPALAGSSLHPALAGVICGCCWMVSALQRGLQRRLSKQCRVEMAKAWLRSDTKVPLLLSYNGVTPAKAGCKEEPTRSRLRRRLKRS